ncbi:MAG: hypothetical protein N2Z62_12905 [Rhodobacteraceae bacterium]|nr:hypothetical protein [Paracoccaceae bacterium]
MNGKRILTVTYGTFSCTLEGFDDAFDTMKAIAEYFRELSAQDRYFGAVPPQPDPEMLREIAERETRRRIEARHDEGGTVLSPQGEGATPAQTPAPAVAPAAGRQPAGGETVAARLARIRALVASQRGRQAEPQGSIFAEDEGEEDGLGDAFADAFGAASGTAPEARALPAAGLPAEPAPFAEAAEPAPAVEEPPLAEAPTAEPAAPFAETPFAEAAGAPMTAEAAPFAEAAESPAADLAAPWAEAPAAEAAEAAPAAAEPPLAEAPSTEPAAPWAEAPAAEAAEPAPAAEEPPLAEAPAAEAAAPFAETPFAKAAEAPVTAEAPTAEPAAPFAEATAPRAVDPAALARATAAMAAAWSRAEGGAGPRPEEAAGASEPSDAGGAGGGGAPVSMFPQLRPAWARDGEGPLHRPRNGFGTPADAPRTAPAAAPAPARPTEGEARVEEQLRSILRALGATGLADDAGTQGRHETPAEAKPGAAAERPAADPAAGAGEDPQARLALGAVQRALGEDDIDRIAAVAQSRLSEAETLRRQAAIAHLKAAVAATEADRVLSAEDQDTGPSELDRYREDLNRAVQQAAEPVQPLQRRPATLVLGASLMVVPPEARRAAAPERHGLTEDTTGATETGTAPISFAEFVDAVSPEGLAELLEAAAAYLSVHEKRKHFSRPQIMRKVASVAGETRFSREEGLRSFGALLRQGRLQKLERGQFALAPNSRFRQETRP